MTEQTNTMVLNGLFVNRVDCYCRQNRDGSYTKISEPLTERILERHLKGEITTASYQLDASNLVKWACFDLDPEKLGDPAETAKEVLAVLLEKKKEEDGTETPRVWPSSIILEASRYPDQSYHVWLLFLLPVKAKVARWLALRTLELANMNPKTVEVFPKQDEITSDRPFGNFVKLPLGKHQVAEKWSRILDLTTFEPLPMEEIKHKHGLSFSENDIVKLESFETKRNVQVTFQTPKKAFKKLSDKDEEKTVSFLTKYWVKGFRNDLQLAFLGMCIKDSVSRDSARRIIQEVVLRTDDEEGRTRLEFVDYHYQNRLNISLKGSSGIREVIEAIREKEQRKQ